MIPKLLIMNCLLGIKIAKASLVALKATKNILMSEAEVAADMCVPNVASDVKNLLCSKNILEPIPMFDLLHVNTVHSGILSRFSV